MLLYYISFSFVCLFAGFVLFVSCLGIPLRSRVKMRRRKIGERGGKECFLEGRNGGLDGIVRYP